MSTPMAKKNVLPNAAKTAKNDEFYTQWADIEREMNAYLEYDPDVFRGKIVLLPCDDPEWSNFAKFFALHLMDYGIKKLVSTSFAADSKPANVVYEPTLFETEAPQYDAGRTRANGKLFVLEQKDVNGDGIINIDDLEWRYLEGDGDFRSDEVTALRDEADIIITNPPFSLFREFVAWLDQADKKFAVIATTSAITYREVFPLIQQDRLWLGKGFPGMAGHFASPYEDRATAADRREGMIRVSGIHWFTNLEHGRRHQPMQLMTESENIRFSKHKQVRGVGYERYVNFDAIDVPYTNAIPSDHEGIMGVPVTFLDKYNPDQFEIVGNSDGYSAAALGVAPLGAEFDGNVGRTKLGLASTKKAVYKRILIRRKKD